MTEKKNNRPTTWHFQPKVFGIWLLIICCILWLWNATAPVAERPNVTWTLHQVIRAAEKNELVTAKVQGDPTRGASWYKVTGKAKLTTETGAPQTVGFEAQGRLTDERYNRLMAASGVVAEEPSSTLWTDILVSMIPVLVIVGILYLLFTRQMRMAGRGAMTFAKSKAKILANEKDKVTFNDVKGCDEAKEEVQEIVDFLKDPKKFEKIGGRIPKGCLMVGPPGTGKTLLARAIAGEADVPFFNVSGSDFVEMFVGVGAARVRDMFEQARKQSPCLLFIDEIDAVGRQRGAGLGGGNDEREQTLNSLLVEMDGFDGREGIIVIAATNRPDVLDGALLRPGRFDRQIVLDLPDLIGREEILKVHSQKIKLAPEVDLRLAARNTPGFAGADLANLLNESALIAARHNKDAVTQLDIDEAREKISYGRERQKLMDVEDKKITAYHEAGHALVQAVVDDGTLPVHKVTIIPRGQSLGSTMFAPKKDILNNSKSRLLNQICCSMGGRIAEELILKEITTGASMDIRQATKLARHMVCDWGMSSLGTVAYGENQEHIFLGKEIARTQNYSEQTAQSIDREINRIVNEQYERAKKILTERREKLETIAQALIEYETLDGQHVHEILDHGALQTLVPYAPKRKEPAADVVNAVPVKA